MGCIGVWGILDFGGGHVKLFPLVLYVSLQKVKLYMALIVGFLSEMEFSSWGWFFIF
jgi:hypothetical protein